MTLLVISPDYASHLYPLATLATAWRDAGERVVVATGPATDAIVTAFGGDPVAWLSVTPLVNSLLLMVVFPFFPPNFNLIYQNIRSWD